MTNLMEFSDLDETWVEKSKSLVQDSSNFTKWMDLLSYTDNLNGGVSKFSSKRDKFLLVLTYENLLTEFPNLEKLWCDLAQWHFKLGDTDKCYDTYKLALTKVLPKSLIIWESYLKFIQFYKSHDLQWQILEFERCRLAIGLHYYSDKFYDMYLGILKVNKLWSNYYALLRRILEIPLYSYAKYFSEWFKAIESCSYDQIKYIIPEKDLQARYQYKYTDFKLENPKILQDLKVKLKKLFIDLYITTQYNSYQCYQYEKRILHHNYNPLHETPTEELQAWSDYLVYYETLLLDCSKSKDKTAYSIQLYYTTGLYERCLLVNCKSLKFWSKYINFLLSLGSRDEELIDVAIRLILHLPSNLSLHMKLIDLLLEAGEYNDALDRIKSLYSLDKDNLSIYSKLLLIENLLHKDSPDHLIDLVRLRLESEPADQINYLFLELQDYKIIPRSALFDFIKSYEQSRGKTSSIYWKIFIRFTSMNFFSKLDEVKKDCKAIYLNYETDLELRKLSEFEDTKDTESGESNQWLDQF